MIKRSRSFALTTTIALLVSLNSYAKTINLYEQPNKNSKTVATVDLSSGIIPIFTPKEGKWVKVADPKNGNVGWVQSSDLSGSGSSTFSFTQSITNGHEAPVVYKFMQFGEPSNVSPEQSQAMMKQVQTQQQAIQKSIQNMMQEMNQQFHNNWQFMHEPFIMPVMVVPVQNTNSVKPKTTILKTSQPLKSMDTTQPAKN